MRIINGETYHIYNQGNNNEKLFYSDADYLHFLELFRKNVLPYCDVFAYCLMPTHFHFLIHASENSAEAKRIGNIDSCVLSNGFRLLQSNYAQNINRKYERSGSLFRQRTKAKPMANGDENYAFTAFHYIHQNPFIAGLVTAIEHWKFSSFPDYAGFRNGSICNRDLAFEILGIDKNNFLKESHAMMDENLIKKIF